MQYFQPNLEFLQVMSCQNSERASLIVGCLIRDMNRKVITKWRFTTFIPKTISINVTMKFGYQLNC